MCYLIRNTVNIVATKVKYISYLNFDYGKKYSLLDKTFPLLSYFALILNYTLYTRQKHKTAFVLQIQAKLFNFNID